MTTSEYISNQISERQQLLTDIHNIITKEDKTVTAAIEPMMGKEMIIYKASGAFKYALSSVKKHISLHVLPMYGSASLFSKYKALLPDANFQKGCINFNNEKEMPLSIVKQLMKDCSKIDMIAVREAYLKSKKEKAKAVK